MNSSRSVRVVVLNKDVERYIVLIDPGQEQAALRQIGLWASDPDLSFSWYDAAYLSKRIRGGQPDAVV